MSQILTYDAEKTGKTMHDADQQHWILPLQKHLKKLAPT
jgi:hypothetical protein